MNYQHRRAMLEYLELKDQIDASLLAHVGEIPDNDGLDNLCDQICHDVKIGQSPEFSILRILIKAHARDYLLENCMVGLRLRI